MGKFDNFLFLLSLQLSEQDEDTAIKMLVHCILSLGKILQVAFLKDILTLNTHTFISISG